ncbi:MAG: PHP domain-containing protein [Nanoarchaeota archaeon]|nr:PHP domain-containing protein [Nanoarchaeota archaeon]
MLKSQLHIHTKEDPQDRLKYSAKEVIDRASYLNFDVIAFTFHDILFFNKELKDYAKSKGILLIPGIEKNIEKKHVLILGLEKLPRLEKLKDLEKIKDKALIIAPHPFYPRHHSLNSKFVKNIEHFHAVEYSFFYLSFFNYFNKKAVKIAKIYNKPLIGTSDLHNIKKIEKTYTLIDAEKNINSIFKAIKNNKIKIITNPLSLREFIWSTIKILNPFSRKRT